MNRFFKKIKIKQIIPDSTLKWHLWFAWRPIYFRICPINGPDFKMRIWWEYIWRQKQWFRGVWGDDWFWHYSFKEEKPDISLEPSDSGRYYGVLGTAYADEAELALKRVGIT